MDKPDLAGQVEKWVRSRCEITHRSEPKPAQIAWQQTERPSGAPRALDRSWLSGSEHSGSGCSSKATTHSGSREPDPAPHLPSINCKLNSESKMAENGRKWWMASFSQLNHLPRCLRDLSHPEDHNRDFTRTFSPDDGRSSRRERCRAAAAAGRHHPAAPGVSHPSTLSEPQRPSHACKDGPQTAAEKRKTQSSFTCRISRTLSQVVLCSARAKGGDRNDEDTPRRSRAHMSLDTAKHRASRRPPPRPARAARAVCCILWIWRRCMRLRGSAGSGEGRAAGF